MYKLVVNYSPKLNAYFIAPNDPHMVYSDGMVAKAMSMPIQDYRDTLMNEFKGVIKSTVMPEIYFENSSDAENAIEWIYSVLVFNKITI